MQKKYMKIAVISDIHSNAVALKAVMEDIALRGCDEIWSLGDYIGEAARPEIVLEMLQKADVKMIIGNREEKILQYHQGDLPEWNGALQFSSLVWNYNRLNEKHFDILKSLSYNFEENINGISILGNHGMFHQLADLAGYDMSNSAHGDEISQFCDRGTDAAPEFLERLFKGMKSDIYLCGHSHIPSIIRKERKAYINPGSISTPIFTKPGVSTYVILSIGENEYEAEIIYVDKDTNAIRKQNAVLGYEKAGGIIARLALYEMRTGKSCMMDYMAYVQKLARGNLGYVPEVIPNELWIEAAENWVFPEALPV